jgi:hypothetical protein
MKLYLASLTLLEVAPVEIIYRNVNLEAIRSNFKVLYFLIETFRSQISVDI